jgi:heme exporter protein D
MQQNLTYALIALALALIIIKSLQPHKNKLAKVNG